MANVLGELFQNIADAIRSKTGESATMKPSQFPDAIAAIEIGGGSSEDVKYVTFMSEDGSEELFKKAVIAGDDCPDVVAKGLLETPTKESTAQYTYSFMGWARSANGGLDETALESITEDRVLYANFASVLRYYTVRFYDGEKLVDTVSVPYGGTATTNYGKDGYSFVAWNPSNKNITGDTDCYGEWEENIYISYALIQRSISQVVNDAIKTVGIYAFYGCTALTTVELGAAKSIDIRAFYGCTALTTVDLGAAESIASYAFYNCTALETLILRGSSMCKISIEPVFNETPIKKGTGYIYVPSALLSAYESDSGWKEYHFRAIEDYPEICGGE